VTLITRDRLRANKGLLRAGESWHRDRKSFNRTATQRRSVDVDSMMRRCER